MTENPLIKAIERLTRLAERDGTAFCKVTWDKDRETFNFTAIPKDFVEVSYEKSHD